MLLKILSYSAVRTELVEGWAADYKTVSLEVGGGQAAQASALRAGG